MHKCTIAVALLLLVTVLSGCQRARPYRGMLFSNQALAVTPVKPPPGFIYQDLSAPLSVNYGATKVQPTKTGTASTRFISLWPLFGPVVSFGLDDASIETAARNGGIKQVTYADYKMFNVLGVFSEFTVIAHGD